MRTALVCVWDIITKLIFNILIKCQFVLRDVFFFYILFIEWYNVQEKLVEANHFQRCNGVSTWLLVPVSTQVPSFLSCDNSYICGKNVDELSYWERSEDEPAATTCFHSTDAQTRFFYPQTFPFLSLFFFSLLRASTDLAKALHFFCIFLCSLFFPHLHQMSLFLPICLFLWQINSPHTLPPRSTSTLFPIPTLLLDIWANNQCHFIPVRGQMEFQLRARQQATTPPALPLFCCRDPRFHQVTTTSSHMHVWSVCYFDAVELNVLVTWRRIDWMDGVANNSSFRQLVLYFHLFS